MKINIINIKRLINTIVNSPEKPISGEAMSILPIVDNAYLIIKDGIIADYGKMSYYNKNISDFALGKNIPDDIIDATGKFVFPAFCDSHTHLIYAGSREQEFTDKIRGLTYKEIARRGGGILNSAELLHRTSEKELYNQALERVKEIMHFGTGAVEIKSGYGLRLSDELKMLRVARRIKEETPLTVKTTFLGAHACPIRFSGDTDAFVDEVIKKMLPVVAAEKLADYVDVFCEDGFFNYDQTNRIFEAAAKYGLRPKVHANQMASSGGVQVGVKNNAISVDHLEYAGDEEIKILKGSDTIPVLLPGATFFMNMKYANARKMIDSGLPLAIASNYNPGSCPSGDMKFEMSLACIKMRMLPEETINATTINGAFAMDVQDILGSITHGKKANLFITKRIPSFEYLPYAFNTPLIEKMFINGIEI